MSPRPQNGADMIRACYNLINNCREDFVMQFTAEELLLLYRAYKRSEWDITPDRWTGDEIEAALRGEGRGAEGDRP
jgi:hypothetical protein